MLGRALSISVRAALTRLAEDGLDGGLPDLWLVPMPSRRTARWARGADPVRALAVQAAATARRSGWPVWAVPALRHRRAVLDQSHLDAVARRQNLDGALEVRPGRRDGLRAAPASWSTT